MEDERFPKVDFLGSESYRILAGLATIRTASDLDPYPHTHDFWEFWIQKDGSCFQILNGTKRLMKPGDFVLARPRDCHSFIPAEKENGSHITFALNSEFFRSYCDFLNRTLYEELLSEPEIGAFMNGSQLEEFSRLSLLFLSSVGKTERKEYLAKRLMAFTLGIVLSSYDAKDNRYPSWLNDLIYEANQPKNLSAFPSDIAQRFPYSYQYVLRTFKKYTGKTLIAYMNDIKMANAVERLLTENVSLLELSNSLGFSSESYFNHLFKKTYGVSPRQYVKRQRVGMKQSGEAAKTSDQETNKEAGLSQGGVL